MGRFHFTRRSLFGMDTRAANLLELPRLGKKLPEFLSIQEIDDLKKAVDVSKNEGHRNRAIIETLYSCGLRVSELINLQITNIYFEEEFIRVIGKGNKERLVPTSPYFIKELGFAKYFYHNWNYIIKINLYTS